MIDLKAEELLKQYRESKDLEIERLLRQYGTSLSDVREMYPQLTEVIKQRQLTTAFPTQPLFFTPSEAAQMGLSLQEGYMLKMTPNEEGYGISFITPSKWEITEDNYYISPSGQRLSEADMQAWLSEPTGQVIPEGWELPTGLLTEKNLTEEGKAMYREYQATGGKLDVKGWIDLRERQQLETEQVFGRVFPQQDIDEVIAYMNEDPKGFLADVREIGPTEDMVALLKSMKFKDKQGNPYYLNDTDIEELFAPTVVPEVTRPAVEVRRLLPFPQTPVWATTTTPLDTIGFPGAYGEIPVVEAAPLKDAAYVFAGSIKQLPAQMGASVLQLIQGISGTGVVNKDWADEWIAEANEDLNAFAQKIAAEYPSSPFLQDISQLSRNLAYSIVTMGGGTLAALPLWLAPEPTTGTKVAATVVTGAVSGWMSFRMVTYQIMQEYLELKDAEMMAQQGRGITLEEENQLKADFHSKAVKYGLWEAIPEGISNMVFSGILTGAFNNALIRVVGQNTARQIGSSLITRFGSKAIGIYGEELLTETITQKFQAAIEVEAGLREKDITWVEAFREIAPQTFLLTTIMAGTGHVVVRVGGRIKARGTSVKNVDTILDSLKNEIGEGNPLYEELKQNIEEQIGKGTITEQDARKVLEAGLAESILQDIEVSEEISKRGMPTLPEITTGQPYTATVYRGYKPGVAPTDEGLFGKGTYYTTNKEYAETYDGKEVMTVNLKNPFVINSQQEAEAFWNETTRPAREQALNEGKTVKEADELAAQAARAWLESKGYDGLIARNIIEKGDEVVVFERKEAVGPEVPVTEVGMPEAGIQPSMLEEVPAKEVRPAPAGKLVQSRMDDYLRLREYNTKATEDRISEIKSLLEKKGRLPKDLGTKGNLSLELARLEALRELDAVDSIEELDKLIREVGEELGLRSMPYAGYGGKSKIDLVRHPERRAFKEYTSRQLEEMLKVYEQARQMIQPEVARARVGPIAPEVETAPVPEGATGRVLARIQIEPAETGVQEKISKGWHTFNVKMIDDLYALNKFTEQFTRGGVDLSIDENPYLLARLLRGISGKANVFLDYGTFGKKFWKIEKKRAVANYTGESLHNILQEVKEPAKWQDFSVYLISRRAVELGERGIETGITVPDALAAIEELDNKYSNFDILAKRVYKYQDNLLVYCKEMGIISNVLLNKLRQYGNYVPFYRVFDELQAKGFMGKKMANLAKPIKRIQGSEREIINPLESIVKNTYVLISTAERNQVGIAMANMVDKNPELSDAFERVKTPMARVAGVTAKELGVEIEGLSEADAEAIVDVFRPSFFVRGDEVTVLIDGKKVYYKVDPDLRDALLNLDRESIGMLGNLLSLPAKWLRAGATLSPDFMVRNPMRDAMSAFVYSNYNFLPGVDFLRGLAGIIGKDADYQLFKASGAEHSMMVSMDREYLNKTFKEVMKGKDFVNYIKHPLELFQIISELGEKATRLGEFKAGIRRGAIPLEAGYSARSVTLDFAQAGTTAHAINRIIAFFNANIRGWGKMISSFREHPVRTSAKIFLGITLPSILLYYANRDDDRWKEIPQWQKDLFWIIMTKDNIYRIPKPFELGIIFGSLPERFMEWLDNKDPELMKDSLLNLAEAGSPGFIPTALLPILEWMTNYSFFRGYSLVPASREKMPPELQYTRWTSEVSKKLGELLNLPPAKIDNLIYGWTGGLGRYAIDVLDLILKGTGISPDIPQPSPTLADIPVIKAFIVRNPYGSSGEAVESFYDLLEEYEQGEKYLKEMLNLGEQEKYEKYKAARPELLFFYDFEKDTGYSASARYLRQLAGQLSELGKKQDEVYQSMTMTPDEKRKAIDEIDMLKTEIARRGLDALIGEVTNVLSVRAADSENLLGTVIEDVPLLSQDKPDIFNMKDLSSDYASIFQGVKWEDISNLPNMPITVKVWFDKEGSEAQSLLYPNIPIYKINADPAQGSTFSDYYRQWQERLKITDPAKLAEFDKLYPKANLGNLTKRQLELLQIYNELTPQEQESFLKDIAPELMQDPREEWLKTHPEDNARLALWGQEKIYTLEAYNLLQTMITQLDIPDKAILGFGLPPKELVTNYFEFGEISNEFGPTSAEAKLYKLDNREYFAWGLDQGIWTDDGSDWNEPVLRLQVQYEEQFSLYDSYGEMLSPNYISGDAARADAREALLFKNGKITEFGTAYYTKKAYEVEFPENLIPNYIEWFGVAERRKDYEDDWWLIEHQDFYKAMFSAGIWKEERNFSKVPTRAVWNLYQQYRALSEGDPRKQFRIQNPILDAWMMYTKKVSVYASDASKSVKYEDYLAYPRGEIALSVHKAPPDEEDEGKPSEQGLQKLISQYGFTREDATFCLSVINYVGFTYQGESITTEVEILDLIDRMSNEFTPFEIVLELGAAVEDLQTGAISDERAQQLLKLATEYNLLGDLGIEPDTEARDLTGGQRRSLEKAVNLYEAQKRRETKLAESDILKKQALEQWISGYAVPTEEAKEWVQYPIEVMIHPSGRSYYTGAGEGITLDVDGINPSTLAHEIAHANYFENLPETLRNIYPYAHYLAQIISPQYREKLRYGRDIEISPGIFVDRAKLPTEGYAVAYQKYAKSPETMPWYLEPFYGNLMYEVPEDAKTDLEWLAYWVRYELEDALGKLGLK